MVHDRALVDQLSALKVERFEGEVFRTTATEAEALAFSVRGGRWAPPAQDGVEVPTLYTSTQRDGSLAEVVSYLMQLTPPPLSLRLKVSRVAVSASKVLRLDRTTLERLNVVWAQYGERDYARTQEIGAAIAFIGCDGLFAPSARWQCDNLMIYQTNRTVHEKLEVIDSEHVRWPEWARASGLALD